MNSPPFITRVVLRHYKSIASCDVSLGPMTWLVGRNGAGKSNFLDALHFVRDALSGTLEWALNERGGLDSVRQRSAGHPKNFSIRLEFRLADGQVGFYAFEIGARGGGVHFVKRERCALPAKGQGPFFLVENGKIVDSSEETRPSLSDDRLALVVMSGLSAFEPVHDALTDMGFYNLNPQKMRELQKPQDGRLLKPEGENIASVLGHLERSESGTLRTIADYLQVAAPMVEDVRRKSVSNMETLEFRQKVKSVDNAWRFEARQMSDGTLRALGILTALFQGNEARVPALIGIEEPETALHPAASAALREAIQRAAEHRQIIITSHSAELLDDDSISADDILAVVWHESSTHIVPIDPAAAISIRDHLYSAGDLLRLEQLAPPPESIRDQQEVAERDLFGPIG